VPILRTLIIPHPIQSLSIYQVFVASHHGNSEDGQGGLEVTPMDIEEDSPQQSGVQGVQDHGSTIN
jgi:hypothetical protein